MELHFSTRCPVNIDLNNKAFLCHCLFMLAHTCEETSAKCCHLRSISKATQRLSHTLVQERLSLERELGVLPTTAANTEEFHTALGKYLNMTEQYTTRTLSEPVLDKLLNLIRHFQEFGCIPRPLTSNLSVLTNSTENMSQVFIGLQHLTERLKLLLKHALLADLHISNSTIAECIHA